MTVPNVSALDAADAAATATGALFLDDGEQLALDAATTLAFFSAAHGRLRAVVDQDGWGGAAALRVKDVVVLGVPAAPTAASLVVAGEETGTAVAFSFDAALGRLTLDVTGAAELAINSGFELQWS
jgi:hypothetical protein